MTNEDRNDEKPELTPVTEEYTQVNANFRMLADIRFKLLALIPTLGGVAIFLLSRMQQSEPKLGYGLLFLISCLGFLATLGVTFYDQRNSELYNALISRARKLETELKLHSGQFLSRPERDRRMFWFIPLGHDSGLALIYGAVLGAWFYPLTSTLLGLTELVPDPERRHGISLTIAALMVALFILELLRLDRTFKRILTSEIEIDAPAERVWRLLTDFDSYPYWNSFVRSISGQPTKGEKLEVRIKPPGGRGMTFKPKVLNAKPNRELRWLGRLLVPGLFDGEHSFIIQSLEENRVRFVQREAFKGLLVPLFPRSLYNNTQCGFERMNRALKERTEAASEQD